MRRQLSVIIPCYNEVVIISDTVKAIDTFLRIRNFDYEIVVVDDGSTDNTYDILKSISRTYQNLKIVTYPKNRGKGYAVRQGLLKAKYDTKLILDADRSVDISQIDLLDIHLNLPFTIIKGQRNQLIRQPLYRIFLGKCFKVLVWIFTGLYMDTQCPFTLMKFSKDFYEDLKIDGFGFDVEILYKAKLLNIRIDKIEVSYVNDERSSVKPKHYIEMFKELIEIRKRK